MERNLLAAVERDASKHSALGIRVNQQHRLAGVLGDMRPLQHADTDGGLNEIYR